MDYTLQNAAAEFADRQFNHDMYNYDLSCLDDLPPSSSYPASSSVENDIYLSNKVMSSKVQSKLSNYTPDIQPGNSSI